MHALTTNSPPPMEKLNSVPDDDTMHKHSWTLMNQKFQLMFNSSTLLFGFESFILSSYLNNYSTDGVPFSDVLSWAVLLIMFSLLIDSLISVISAHLAGFHEYQAWHRVVLTFLQWTTGLAAVLFVLGINLIVADSGPLGDGFKIAIYAFTGVCFSAVVVYYVVIAVTLRNSRVESFINALCCAH